MDYETIPAETFGAALRGLGLNLITRDVGREAAFLTEIFAMTAHRMSADFAILTYGPALFQLHRDATFAGHPLLDLLPENPPRGVGIELRLYDTDPDAAVARAEARGDLVLRAPQDRPHGLREAVILSPDGYAWVPSRPLDPAAAAVIPT